MASLIGVTVTATPGKAPLTAPSTDARSEIDSDVDHLRLILVIPDDQLGAAGLFGSDEHGGRGHDIDVSDVWLADVPA